MTAAPAATRAAARRLAATLDALAAQPLVATDARTLQARFRAEYVTGTWSSLEASRAVWALRTVLTETVGRLSDEALTVEAAEYRAGFTNGNSRAAHYLLDCPAEARSAVEGEANLMSNMTGGRYADCVQTWAARPAAALRAREEEPARRAAARR